MIFVQKSWNPPLKRQNMLNRLFRLKRRLQCKFRTTVSPCLGAITLSIMTLSIMTLSIMTITKMTLTIIRTSIMTLSITTFSIAIRKCDTQHYDVQCLSWMNVVMLNVICRMWGRTCLVQHKYGKYWFLECHCNWRCFYNGTPRIRHQWRKTAVLSCHSFLINSGVEKMNNI